MICHLPMRFQSLALLIIFSLIFFGERALAADAVSETVTLKPEASAELLINPGKGWVLYGAPDAYSPELQACASLGYVRTVWGAIEPEENQFHWEKIDVPMRKWAARGQQTAIAICGASSHSTLFWTSPKWVFDAGAAYETFELSDPKRPTAGVPGKKLVPVFDDPIYVEKLRHFVKALAERYDGHPNVAFVDIRSYGNWGEGHMSPFGRPLLPPEKYLELVKVYRDAFQKTRLALPVGGKIRQYATVYQWAVEHGITIRRDGICGNSNGSETAVCAGKFPSIFEFYGGYDMLKKLGWWDGIQDQNHCGYRLTDCIETGRPSWLNLSQRLLEAEPDLVRTVGNRLGYHFVISSLTFPTTLRNGQPFSVQTNWENRGGAFLFLPAKVTFALRDSSGNPVAFCDAPQTRLEALAPDAPTFVTDVLTFPTVPAGTYTLSLGILPGKDCPALWEQGRPFIRLGVNLSSQDGWYALGEVTVP